MTRASPPRLRILVLAFFLSGASALLYELVANRYLTLVFGCMADAAAAVLATYMLGLSLGSWLGGRLADRVERSFLAYAAAELGVAAGCLALAPGLKLAGALYVSLASPVDPGTAGATLLRMAVAAPVLLVPTMLMGATMPLLVRGWTALSENHAQGIATLYAANTAGAAAGVLAGNYLVLPAVGLGGGLVVAALADVAAAALVLGLGPGAAPVPGPEPAAPPAPDAGTTPADPSTRDAALSTRGVLAGILLGSFTLFALEVVWTHLLAVTVGNTVYAFGAMLFAVLIGLALGGHAAAGIGAADRAATLVRAPAQLGLLVVLTLPLWDRLSLAFDIAGPRIESFAGRELVRLAVCALMLVGPCITAGLAFPLAVSLAARPDEKLGRETGAACAVSTVGAISGALAGSFLLLPLLGSYRSLEALAVAALVTSLVYARAVRPPAVARTLGPTLAVALVILALVPRWDIDRLTDGANVYFQSQAGHPTVFLHEDKHGGVTTVRAGPHERILLTNGKFQGNDTDEIPPQVLFASIPCLLVQRYERALVIGLGTGTSAGVVAAHPFRKIDVAEISPGIVEAARRYFRHVNRDVLDDPRVTLRLADGRNHLLLTRDRYDLIVMEISSIWFAGAASLYSRQFYELARHAMAPGGVMQQWIQLHHITVRDVASVVASMRAVFPHVSLWLGARQGILVASVQPQTLTVDSLAARNAVPELAAARNLLPARDFRGLFPKRVLSPAGADAWLAAVAASGGMTPDGLVCSDDHNRLEYSTPRGNALTADMFEEMMASMAPFRGR